MYKHIVADGDTLQSISARYTGSRSNWVKLGEFNNLLSTQLEVGTFVNIPKFDQFGTIISTQDVDQDTDLYLLEDMSVDVSGDLGIVTGLDSVVQEMQRRFQTPKGEIPLHPNWGSKLSELVANGLTNNLKRVELEILETMYQDDRVTKAQVLSITKVGKGLSARCRAEVDKSVVEFDTLV